jgi:hypothetical protein
MADLSQRRATARDGRTRAPGSVGDAKLRLLLASSSVAALLIGGGTPRAYPAVIAIE